MKIVYLTPILIIFLNSCFFSNCEQVYMSNSEKEWIESIQLGDTLLYSCLESNSIDTFVVDFCSTSFTECNKIAFGNLQYEQANLKAKWITSIADDLKYNCGFSFRATKEMQKDSVERADKTFNVFDYHTSYLNDINKEVDTRSVYVSFIGYEIEGYHFTFDKVNPEDKYCSRKIKEYVWNKKYGLISYTLLSGEEYSLKDVF